MKVKKAASAGTMESSDIMITVEPGENGIEIDLSSDVEKQYGNRIRQVIADTVSELQIEGIRITAVDKGAMDCTVRARVKTAVLRAIRDGEEPA